MGTKEANRQTKKWERILKFVERQNISGKPKSINISKIYLNDDEISLLWYKIYLVTKVRQGRFLNDREKFAETTSSILFKSLRGPKNFTL